MAKAKHKPTNPFTGRWRIVSMEQWDQDYVDEEEEGYFEFTDECVGEFHFGYVHGQMDCRLTTRGGVPAIEWTWDGNDEMEAVQGRGCATETDGKLHGTIFFHHGDDSDFVAQRGGKKKRARKR
jgi:hypothetical protein